MLNIVSLSNSNGNSKVVDEKEEELIKLTLIVKSNKDGSIEVISSQSEPYKLELVEDKEEAEKIKRKIKYNTLTGVISNRIKEAFNKVEVNETTVYIGFRINRNCRYDIIITPLSKNRAKIDLPIKFLDLINLEYKTNNVFSYLGHVKIDKPNEFTYLLNNYKDYLEML